MTKSRKNHGLHKTWDVWEGPGYGHQICNFAIWADIFWYQVIFMRFHRVKYDVLRKNKPTGRSEEQGCAKYQLIVAVQGSL